MTTKVSKLEILDEYRSTICSKSNSKTGYKRLEIVTTIDLITDSTMYEITCKYTNGDKNSVKLINIDNALHLYNMLKI